MINLPLFFLLLLSSSLVQWEVATTYHPLAICPILASSFPPFPVAVD